MDIKSFILSLAGGGTAGKDGVSPTVTKTGNTGSGEIAGYIKMPDQPATDQIIVYNGAQGEKGDKGDPGAAADMGSLVADVEDTVTSDNNSGVDTHEISVLRKGGTKGDVGSFYIAQKQITKLNSDGSFMTVDQEGAEKRGRIDAVMGTVGGSLEDADGPYAHYAKGMLYPQVVNINGVYKIGYPEWFFGAHNELCMSFTSDTQITSLDGFAVNISRRPCIHSITDLNGEAYESDDLWGGVIPLDTSPNHFGEKNGDGSYDLSVCWKLCKPDNSNNRYMAWRLALYNTYKDVPIFITSFKIIETNNNGSYTYTLYLELVQMYAPYGVRDIMPDLKNVSISKA